MLHEMRFYTIRTDRLKEFLAVTRDLALPIRGERYGRLLGYWISVQGVVGRVVHLWAYRDGRERAEVRAEMMANPRWVGEYVPASLPMVVEQSNWLLTPLGADEPPKLAGYELYELVVSALAPGTLIRWTPKTRAFKELTDGTREVGMWAVECGPLNTIVQLLAHKTSASWVAAAQIAIDGSADLQPQQRVRTDRTLLIPSEFSPLR